MQVFLEAIKFNHDPTFKTTGAFNIRRNEKTRVQIPEWTRNKSERPEDSPAAYVLESGRNLNLPVKAKFSCTGRPNAKLMVKAVLEEFVDPAGSKPGNPPTVLGETAEIEVLITRGKSRYETFTLENGIGNTGVGIKDITWRWQHSDGASPHAWNDFALSHHRIYSVLGRPKCPWKPDGPHSDTQVPWTEVLNLACCWAANTRHIDDAATEITRRVNRLGDEGLVYYDNPNSGTGNFTYEFPFVFDCSDFLQLLAGRKNNGGPKVNCDDCAAIVVSTANILGCTLNEGMMGDPSFFLKRHLRIGLPKIYPGGKFSHHTVAWKGSCAEDDEVFDACLQLDYAGDPKEGSQWSVPANKLFGHTGQQHYRFHLAAEPPPCNPEKIPRRRRIGFPKSKKTLAECSKLSENNPFLSRYVLRRKNLSTWRFRHSRFIETGEQLYLNQSFWDHKNGNDASLGIDAYECNSVEDAQKTMSRILSTFQLADMVQEKRASFGDVVFAVPTNYAILLRRGRFVLRFRNTGDRMIACNDVAQLVDNLLITIS